MRKVSKKADIFAVAAVYYYLCTGYAIDVHCDLATQLSGFSDFDLYFLSNCLAYAEEDRWETVEQVEALLRSTDRELFSYLNASDSQKLQLIEGKVNQVEPVIDNMDAAEDLVSWLEHVSTFENEDSTKKWIEDQIIDLKAEWADAFDWHFRDGGNEV